MQHCSVEAARAYTDDGGPSGSCWRRPWRSDALTRLWYSLGTYSQHILCASETAQLFLGRAGTPTQNSDLHAELRSCCGPRVCGVRAESASGSRQVRVREAHGAVRTRVQRCRCSHVRYISQTTQNYDITSTLSGAQRFNDNVPWYPDFNYDTYIKQF